MINTANGTNVIICNNFALLLMVTIVTDLIEAISSNMFSQHNCPHLKDNHVMHVYIIMFLLLEEIDYLGTTDKNAERSIRVF